MTRTYQGTWKGMFAARLTGGSVTLSHGQFATRPALATALQDAGLLPKGGRIKSVTRAPGGSFVAHCSVRAQYCPELHLSPVAR